MDADRVELALADLAVAAVSRLAVEMATAELSKDRISAANSILDRLGYGRSTRAQADVADKEIKRALAAVQGAAEAQTGRALPAAPAESPEKTAREAMRDAIRTPSPGKVTLMDRAGVITTYDPEQE